MISPSSIRAVLFDFGGTLGYDCPSYQEGFATLCTAMGYRLDRAGYYRASAAAEGTVPEAPREPTQWRAWRREFNAAILREIGVPEADLPRIVDTIAERLRYYTRPYCYPETGFVLRSLQRAGYTLGVISNIAPVLPLVLGELGIDRYLDFAIASQAFGAEKPDQRIFEEGLRLAGVPAASAMYVGDSIPADVDGSRAVGMLPVLIDRAATGARCEGALVVTNLTQTLDWLGVDVWGEPSLHDVVPSR